LGSTVSSQLNQPHGLSPPAQFQNVPASTKFELRTAKVSGSSTTRVTPPVPF
jgi:hypothetical protein